MEKRQSFTSGVTKALCMWGGGGQEPTERAAGGMEATLRNCSTLREDVGFPVSLGNH